MERRLYLYYSVPEAALADTLTAVRVMQRALRLAHPGLQTELMRRPEVRDGEVTLMETYAGAVTLAFEAALADAARALPQPRHLERFEPP